MTEGERIQQARRLMREGLGDEAIEAATGLPLLDILELRAKAAVEGTPGAPPTPRGTPARG